MTLMVLIRRHRRQKAAWFLSNFLAALGCRIVVGFIQRSMEDDRADS